MRLEIGVKRDCVTGRGIAVVVDSKSLAKALYENVIESARRQGDTDHGKARINLAP